MSYSVDYRGGEFHIDRSHKEQAESALRKYCAEHSYDSDGDLETLLERLGWEAYTDNQGNIEELELFDGEIYGDEEEYLDAIAPYVNAGSHIVLEGEDGHIWCYYFDGVHRTTHAGEIVFSITRDHHQLEIRIAT